MYTYIVKSIGRSIGPTILNVYLNHRAREKFLSSSMT